MSSTSNGTVGTVGTNGAVGANHSTNRLPSSSKAKRKPAKRGKGKAMVVGNPRLALGLTVGAGIGIPALTLSLSTVAGQLMKAGHYGLGGSTAVVCCTVLAVSLSHLAWAVGDITRSPRWASWLLAIAVDCGLVLCETVTTFAPGVVDTLAHTIMVAVTLASMALNVWAFLCHRPAK